MGTIERVYMIGQTSLTNDGICSNISNGEAVMKSRIHSVSAGDEIGELDWFPNAQTVTNDWRLNSQIHLDACSIGASSEGSESSN